MNDKAVVFENVSVSFGDLVVIDNVSFEIEKGEFVAVIGPNGAGKTTLLKTIFGFLKPDKGSIKIFGMQQPLKEISRFVGYLPQVKYFPKNSPFALYEMLETVARLKKVKVDADEILRLVNLETKKRAFVGELSGGMQRRFLLALTLIGNPGLVLLDEPTTGLDIASKENVLETIGNLHQSLNNTVVIVTHNVNEVYPYMDRIIYINKNVFAVGTPEEVLTAELLEEIYGVPVEVFRHGEKICVLAGDVHYERTR